MNKIFFRPERFTPDSQMLYWKAFTPEGKKTHEAAINELNANIRELIDVGEISLSNDELEKKLNE